MILRELISKLQEAPCGDPALDFWVWWWGEEAGPSGSEPEEHFADERILAAAVPQYSSNLDIAAQLVPEGYQWRLEKHNGRYVASVASPWGDLDAQMIEARDAALALCAAALRCRLRYVREVMRGRQ
jgi:hypothetical protein